jgi:hypothetical protein
MDRNSLIRMTVTSAAAIVAIGLVSVALIFTHNQATHGSMQPKATAEATRTTVGPSVPVKAETTETSENIPTASARKLIHAPKYTRTFIADIVKACSALTSRPLTLRIIESYNGWTTVPPLKRGDPIYCSSAPLPISSTTTARWSAT